jgi:hypothetical protein
VTSPLVQARVLGVLNLAVLFFGSFPIFVQSRTLVPGDPVATADAILASEPLFRLGIASGVVMSALFVFIALSWYRLLSPVGRGTARAMAALILVSLPIALVNELNQVAALLLAHEQEHSLVSRALELHGYGVTIAGLFWGLWLFPLGLLVYRSGFLPRALGVLLMVGSPGWVIRFVQGLLFPGSEATLWSNPPLVLTHVAELAMTAWLLIKGIDVEAWRARAARGAAA